MMGGREITGLSSRGLERERGRGDSPADEGAEPRFGGYDYSNACVSAFGCCTGTSRPRSDAMRPMLDISPAPACGPSSSVVRRAP